MADESSPTPETEAPPEEEAQAAEETEAAAEAEEATDASPPEEAPPSETQESVPEDAPDQQETAVEGESSEAPKQQASKDKEGDPKKKSKSIIFEEKEAEGGAPEAAEGALEGAISAAERLSAAQEGAPEAAEEAPEAAEGAPAAAEGPPPAEPAPAPSKVPAEEKQRRRKSRAAKPAPGGKSRLTVAGKGRRPTVYKSKIDLEGKPRFQNTYRLDSKNPFSVDRVYTIIKTIVDETLKDVTYNPENCAKLVAFMSNEIRTRVKLQAYERYKIGVQVIIGEKKHQSIYSILRFLWDVDRDHYSFYSYESSTLFAVALAFGVYYE